MTGPFPSAGAAAIAVLWSPCSWRSRALLRSPADYYAASMLLVVLPGRTTLRLTAFDRPRGVPRLPE